MDGVVSTPQPIFLKTIESGVERHTGEYMYNVLSTEIDSTGPDKVGAVVTDVPNMKAAWKLLTNVNLLWMHCPRKKILQKSQVSLMHLLKMSSSILIIKEHSKINLYDGTGRTKRMFTFSNGTFKLVA